VKTHAWEIEEWDGGTIGVGHFWVCKACGASGGPVVPGRVAPTLEPFIGDGSGIKLSLDCDEARLEVLAHEAWENRPHDPPEACPECGVMVPTCTCGVWGCGYNYHLRVDCKSPAGDAYRKEIADRERLHERSPRPASKEGGG
jgi:hypothetical protein